MHVRERLLVPYLCVACLSTNPPIPTPHEPRGQSPPHPPPQLKRFNGDQAQALVEEPDTDVFVFCHVDRDCGQVRMREFIAFCLCAALFHTGRAGAKDVFLPCAAGTHQPNVPRHQPQIPDGSNGETAELNAGEPVGRPQPTSYHSRMQSLSQNGTTLRLCAPGHGIATGCWPVLSILHCATPPPSAPI